MAEILLALRRTVSSLGRGRIWLYILGPAVVAALFMGLASATLLDRLSAGFLGNPPLRWLVSWGVLWLAKALALLGAWLILLAASYLVAMLLTALALLPLMLGYLAPADYADLERRGRDSLVESTRNSIVAALIFIAGMLMTLPLWFIPGMGLLLSLFWVAWLNRRTLTYDVLAAHATAEEWREIRQRKGSTLLMLGVLMALLTSVPVVGLLAPSLAALAYIHFCLEALRELRREGEPLASQREKANRQDTRKTEAAPG